MLDGVSAFPRSCLPVSPLVSLCLPLFPLSPHMCACVGWCVRLPEVLSPLVSHCLPTCVPLCACVEWCVRLPEVLSPLVSACLPLSPHMCACVVWCVRLPEVLPPLVSHCLPTCVPVLDAVSAFPRSCLLLSPIVSPHMCACVGWCVRLPEVLSPQCLPAYVCLCWMVCLPSQVLVFPCLHCLPMPQIALIVSHCLPLSPIVSPHVCLCWMVCSPSPGVPVLDGVSTFPSSCLSLCPSLSPIVSRMCWMMCPPFRGLVSLSCFLLLDAVSAFPRSPCLPKFSLVSHCLPSCFLLLDGVCPPSRGLVSPLVSLLLDGVSAMPRPFLPLSPFLFSFVGWSVCLPEVLSSLVSSHVCPCWMVCPPPQGLANPCLPMSPHMGACVVCPPSGSLAIVSPHVCLCWMACPPSRGAHNEASRKASKQASKQASKPASQPARQGGRPSQPASRATEQPSNRARQQASKQAGKQVRLHEPTSVNCSPMGSRPRLCAVRADQTSSPTPWNVVEFDQPPRAAKEDLWVQMHGEWIVRVH